MKRILMGCGIAALAVCALLVVGGVLVGSWVRSKIPDTKKIEAMHADLEAKFGPAESYVPPLDGTLDPARLALFASLRDSLVAPRRTAGTNLGGLLQRLAQKRPAERGALDKALDAVTLARSGTGLAASMIDYYVELERTLLANGMGPGEYRYLYSLVYFAWLEWDPAQAPGLGEELERLDLRREVEQARARYGDMVRKQLDNQRRELEAKPARTAAEDAALATVSTELATVAGSGGFPFLGRVPAPMAAALEPLRARLAATLPQSPPEVWLDLFRATPKSRGGFHVDVSR